MTCRQIGGVAAALLLGAYASNGFCMSHVDSGPTLRSSAAGGGGGSQAMGGAVTLPNFVGLVKKEGPAVVTIITQERASKSPTPPATKDGEALRDFFERLESGANAGEAPAKGSASGFIISPDGFILTNAHVVANTTAVSVRLTSRREYPARVVGADRVTDVAVLKIEASELPSVRTGDPSSLEVGEWVAAIGTPFGFENSVTVGVVSAKGRLLPEGNYVPFIQTDVVVNPGNSGGPLFSTRGEVVAINSGVFSQTGSYMGLSFAIPIDIAMEIAKQLRETGRVVRGRIGVRLEELTYERAASIGMRDFAGALVSGVQGGGPADGAGIRVGDVFLSVNDQPVQNVADLSRLIGRTPPGAALTAQIWRNRATVPVRITVGASPKGD